MSCAVEQIFYGSLTFQLQFPSLSVSSLPSVSVERRDKATLLFHNAKHPAANHGSPPGALRYEKVKLLCPVVQQIQTEGKTQKEKEIGAEK